MATGISLMYVATVPPSDPGPDEFVFKPRTMIGDPERPP